LQIKNLKLKQFKGNLDVFVEQNPEAKSYFDIKSSKLAFNFPQPGPIEGINSRSKALMKMVNCTFTYPSNTKPTLFDISVSVSMASRVSCVGENGAGKSTMIKLLTGEIVPQVGEVWKHSNARVAYVPQHAFHSIEKHMDKTPNEYIRWRYEFGEDKEFLVKATMIVTPEEEKLRENVYEMKDPANGKLVKKFINELTGNRRKPKSGKDFEYEVKFRGDAFSSEGTFVPQAPLFKLGWEKECKAIDARIAQTANMFQRALTASNIEKHLGDVGLEAEFATHYRMAALSGGQKVKVVMGAALWNQPHILILDEPTNYLDRESLGALAKAIESFQGGVVIISHHNEFVKTICSEEWVMDSGRLTTVQSDTAWMDRQDDKIEDTVAITTIMDAVGNTTEVKIKKKMTKREEKIYAKCIKDKIDGGEELDSDEEDFAINNNIY
jgi:elongation factor 3